MFVEDEQLPTERSHNGDTMIAIWALTIAV